MESKREPETEGSSYIRLPWPLVAVGIFAFLAVLLGAGLYANRCVRPQIGIVPTQTVAPIGSGATTTPVPVSTVVVTPLVLGLTSPTATTIPVSVVATALPGSPATLSPPALPTMDSALADEVGRAYRSVLEGAIASAARSRRYAFAGCDARRLPTGF
jgi:hypothetical protein